MSEINFLEGAPADSRQWDNRRKTKWLTPIVVYDLDEINRCIRELQQYQYKKGTK